MMMNIENTKLVDITKDVDQITTLDFAADLLLNKELALLSALAYPILNASEHMPSYYKPTGGIHAEVVAFCQNIKANSKGKLCKVNIKFFTDIEYKNTTLYVMLQGFGDFGMVVLGRKFGLPRGCAIVWKKSEHMIDIRGFYRKFENDDRAQMQEWQLEQKEEGGVNTATIDLKVSGSLVHIIAHKEEQNNVSRWMTCSKNSASHSSPFIQRSARVVGPFMTPQLVERLATEKLYLGGEIMCVEDDSHGYVVKQDCFVITCIGSAVEEEEKEKAKQIMKYWSKDAIIDFCNQYGLPCNDAVTIQGPRTVEILDTMLPIAKRDTMLYTDYAQALEAIVARYTAEEEIQILKAKVGIDHLKVIGNVCEGLVIVLNKTDRFKYKLPSYTARTFFLRTILNAFLGNKKALTVADVITPENNKEMETYLSKWCCTEEGRVVFRQALKAMMMLAVGRMVENSTHVHLADEVMFEKTEAERGALAQEYDSLFSSTCDDDKKAKNKVYCILVTGPIGSGKSTFASQLAEILIKKKQSVCLIDGDVITEGGMASTLKLSIERNPCTLAKFTKAWRQNQIVICSMGGGVVTRTSSSPTASGEEGEATTSECFLHQLVKDEFGSDFQLCLTSVTTLASPSFDDSASKKELVAFLSVEEGLEEVEASYARVTYDFSDAVKTERVEVRKVWDAKGNYKDLHEHSMKNKMHTLAIMRAAGKDNCFGAPFSLVPTETMASIQAIFKSGPSVFNLLVGPLIAKLQQKTQQQDTVNKSIIHQIRSIVSIQGEEKCKHITHMYEPEGVKMSQTEIDALSETIDNSKKSMMDILTLTLQPSSSSPSTTTLAAGAGKATKGKKDDNNTVKVTVGILANGSHVTISPGPFQPKDMAKVAAWWLSSEKKEKEEALELTEKKSGGKTFVIKELNEGTPSSGGKDGTPFIPAVPANYFIDKNRPFEVLIKAAAFGFFHNYVGQAFVPRAVAAAAAKKA